MRYAVCNETFTNWEHPRVCEYIAKLGYTGLEMAPFTLANRITEVTAEQRRTLRRQAEEQGVQIIGLHWLLAKTEGLQLTATDAAVRQRTAEYIVELARCSRDLGGELMVFGSPAQRRIPAGTSREQATLHALDTFRRALPGLAETGIVICLEPLSPPEADFINTCAEAVEMLEVLKHPCFALHQDVKAMSTEVESTPDLIRKYAKYTRHFHANDPNLKGPGFGNTDFVPIFQALRDTKYTGWVSVEVFDYTPDPETIARESLRYMREVLASVQADS